MIPDALQVILSAELAIAAAVALVAGLIHGYTGFGPTHATTDEDIRISAEAVEATCRVIKAGLENDSIDDLLTADTRTEPFRRIVR